LNKILKTNNTDSLIWIINNFCIIQDVILSKWNECFWVTNTSHVACQWPSHPHTIGEALSFVPTVMIVTNTPPSLEDDSEQVTLLNTMGNGKPQM
jgi:hypothetical protein